MMNLFSQSLILFCSVAASALCAVYLGLSRTKPGFVKKLTIALSVAAVATIGIVLLLNQLFTLKNIPISTYFFSFAIITMIVLVGLQIRQGWAKFGFGLGVIVSLVLVEALTANSFYHFYPTLASIVDSGQRPDNLSNAVVKTASNTKAPAKVSLEQSLSADNAAAGKVVNVSIPGAVSQFNARDAIVYLPPAYISQNNPDIHFPVLIMLNGTPGSPSDLVTSADIVATADTFASRHNGLAPIIVMPDHNGSRINDTECSDSPRGNVETYLTVDVPAYIKQKLHASTKADNWAIGGLSEGGMCSAMLTLRHQDVYRHFLDMSGEPSPNIRDVPSTVQTLFGGSTKAYQEHSIDWLLENTPLNKNLTGQFVIGREDDQHLIKQMQHTYALSRKRNMNVSLELIPNGGHSYSVWSRGFRDSLPKLSYDVGATKCETDCVSN